MVVFCPLVLAASQLSGIEVVLEKLSARDDFKTFLGKMGLQVYVIPCESVSVSGSGSSSASLIHGPVLVALTQTGA